MSKPNIRYDCPVIRLYNGDVELGIRLLKRKLDAGKVFKILKMRREHPSRGDRRRYKQFESERRLRRLKSKRRNHG
jgi:ribosomal protein S21